MRPFGKESPNSIYQWNQLTFDQPSVTDIANRANLEIAELLIAIQFNYAPEKIHEEIADVCIMLWAVAAGLNQNARPTLLPDEQQGSLQCATLLNSRYAIFLHALNKGKGKGSRERYLTLQRALINLEALIASYQLDIAALVDAKMQINRNRKWKNVEGGNYQHVA